MTDQDLISKGFKQFNPIQGIDSDGIETRFQKRYDDEVGKKYFITVNKWKPITHPYSGEVFPVSYEYETQFYKKDGKDDAKAINLVFHSAWELEEVEDYTEKLFATVLFDYYKKWDEC